MASRKMSLVAVLALVFSSTVLTITAQARLGAGFPLGSVFSLGMVPGTTTEYGGTRPKKISPVARLMIRVDCPMKTPIEMTLPFSIITPSAISERAPMKQSSSMITGLACRGSSTPPIPVPPEMCTRFPI